MFTIANHLRSVPGNDGVTIFDLNSQETQTLNLMASFICQCLQEGRFSASGFLERFGVRTTKDGFTRIHRNDLKDDLQSILVRLFVLGDSVRKETLLRSGVNNKVSAAFERLDMVRSFIYAP